MIESLKSDKLINQMGGRFKLTALIQKRWRELLNGERAMVERGNLTEMEVVVKEIVEGKITIDFENSDIDIDAIRKTS